MDSAVVGGQAELKAEPLSKDFKIFILSRNLLNQIAFSTFYLVVAWFVISLTGSPFYTGVADTFLSLPLAFSFLTGALVNSMRAKRRILIVGTLLSGLASLILLISLLKISLLLILLPAYLACGLLAIFQDISGAAGGYFGRALLTDAQVKRGTMVSRITSSTARITGMMLSGILLVLSFYYAIYFVSVIFVASAAVFAFTDYRDPKAGSGEREKVDLGSGIRFMFGNAFFREVTISAIAVNFFFGMFGTAMAILVKAYFDLPAYYYSVILAMEVVGDIIGSVATVKLKTAVGKMFSPILSAVGALVVMMFVSAYRFLYWPIPVLMFVVGFLLGILNVILSGIFLKATPKEKAAAIGGTATTLFMGATVASGSVIGILMQYINAPEAIGIVGIVTVIVGAYSFFGFKNIRKAEL